MIPHPFNWERDCPFGEFARRSFGRIVGRGRGLDLDALEQRRLTRGEEVHLRDFLKREWTGRKVILRP